MGSGSTKLAATSDEASAAHRNTSLAVLAAIVAVVAVFAFAAWTQFRSTPMPMLILSGGLASVLVALLWSGRRLREVNAHLTRQLEETSNALRTARRDLDVVIRDRRRVEQDLMRTKDEGTRAVKAKSEFLANMSHEIRTPMNGVLGMTELLLGTELNRKQRHFAETIHRSGEQLLAIINDILDFSKIEAGKLLLNETAFDLRRLLEDINDMFADQAHRKGLELACVFPADLHSVFRADAFRLKQILSNLISNAVKFTERGEVITRVQKLSEGQDRITLRIEVSDTGVGIRAEALPRLFNSFSQADASTTKQYGGTGLGLAICKQLANLMGGDVGAHSEQGRGSTFWVQLTLLKAQRDESDSAARNLSGLRMLVVDDNATSRETLQHQLQAWGMQTLAVASGREALAALQKAVATGHPFDAAIFDHSMPGMSSIELARSIKATREIAEVRLIMLTAVGNLEDTGQWLAAGVDAYIDKPVRQLELQKSLLRVLGRAEHASVPPLAARGPESMCFAAHVLVAEDNPVNQELIVAALEGLGCRVRVVDNGREVVEAVTSSPLDLTNDPYDLVLMDCQMPQMDGYAATAAIRKWAQTDPSAKRLPIIALTANAMEGDRERCLKAGMDDYLAKPLRQTQLTEVLQRWLPLQSLMKPVTAARPVSKDQLRNEPSTKTRGKVMNNVLDLSALERIRALQRPGGPDILAKVVSLYLEKTPELLTGIRDAVSRGDADKLRNSAHSLKSSSANVGAEKVAVLCKELEMMGREAKLDNAEATVGVLEFEFQAACAALKDQLTKRAA